MTRLGFAMLALVLVVFSELETSRSLARLVFVLGGLPVAWLFVRGFRGGGPRFPRLRNPLSGRRRASRSWAARTTSGCIDLRASHRAETFSAPL